MAPNFNWGRSLKVVTRKSRLALAQTKSVVDALLSCHPALNIELDPIDSEGDLVLDQALQKIGGKGLFTLALEERLLSGKADFAVHSLKDMPAEIPEGLCLAGVTARADSRDVLVLSRFSDLLNLPKGARVGTSSLRRQAQLLALRSDLNIQFLRGNVDTRLNKLANGQYDAIILAMAGLLRLGILEMNTTPFTLIPFSLEEILPAVGQAALALECRNDDLELHLLLQSIRDPSTEVCVRAERSMNAALGGNCQTPIAGHATDQGNGILTLVGLVASEDGRIVIRDQHHGSKADPECLGRQVAEGLKSQGALSFIRT